MKILKYVLAVIVLIIAVPLLIALFVDTDFHVKRSIEIDKPKAEVFSHIRSLKNQDKFSVWAQKDPNMKTTYIGNDGEVGFVSAWESENEEIGKGSQEITRIEENKRLETKLRFISPFESESTSYMATKSSSFHSTNVTWGMQGEFKYPTNLMFLFYDMDEAVGTDLEKGLENLKNNLEKRQHAKLVQ